MKHREWEEHQAKECRERWFKKHVAHRHDYLEQSNIGLPISVIDWREPGTSIFAIRYIISGRSLMVTGDAGDAVFEWSEGITFEFLNNCNLGYFAGKCQASEVGRRYVQWDSDACRDNGFFTLSSYSKEVRDAFSEADMFSEQEMVNWLWNDAPDEIRSESELCSLLIENGQVMSVHCIGMWVGIKMAMEQLNKEVKSET